MFSSYSWDNNSHKDWVRYFADELIKNGIETILDQYDLDLGNDKFLFMESSVREADTVLCICTPSYIKKSNERSSGVGTETSLITPQFFSRVSEKKQFIPVVRKADDVALMPDYLSALIFVDFRDDADFSSQIEQLLRHLHKKPKLQKPSIGSRPF